MPPGKLLGGSSKLAALAAARKKKEADKAAVSSTSSATETDRTIGLLDRLGTKKGDDSSPSVPNNQSRTMTFPSRQKKAVSPERPAPVQDNVKVDEAPVRCMDDLKATPSIFAQTLLGDEPQSQGGVSLGGEFDANDRFADNGHQFSLPYMADPDYVKRDPFTKPSPDDIVLRAQGKDTSRD